MNFKILERADVLRLRAIQNIRPKYMIYNRKNIAKNHCSAVPNSEVKFIWFDVLFRCSLFDVRCSKIKNLHLKSCENNKNETLKQFVKPYEHRITNIEHRNSLSLQ
jgi:hypothetical protein